MVRQLGTGCSPHFRTVANLAPAAVGAGWAKARPHRRVPRIAVAAVAGSHDCWCSGAAANPSSARPAGLPIANPAGLTIAVHLTEAGCRGQPCLLQSTADLQPAASRSAKSRSEQPPRAAAPVRCEQGAAAAMGPSRTAHFLTVSSTLSSSNLRYHVEGA